MRSSHEMHKLAFIALALPCSLAPGAAHGQTTTYSSHLAWEEDLVAHVAPENNTYGTSPSFVTWAGVGGATEYTNRSMCTTFLTRVLMQAYGLSTVDFRAWFGSSSPNAARYHDTIAAEIGFRLVTTVEEIAPGDILALKYPPGETATGHVATVAAPAVARRATTPLVPETAQYEIEVVDSSSSGHGPFDTRRKPDGSWHSGAGRGIMRLYADRSGAIVGYTWSTYTTSLYYSRAQREVVVGRLVDPWISLPLPE